MPSSLSSTSLIWPGWSEKAVCSRGSGNTPLMCGNQSRSPPWSLVGPWENSLAASAKSFLLLTISSRAWPSELSPPRACLAGLRRHVQHDLGGVDKDFIEHVLVFSVILLDLLLVDARAGVDVPLQGGGEIRLELAEVLIAFAAEIGQRLVLQFEARCQIAQARPAPWHRWAACFA